MSEKPLFLEFSGWVELDPNTKMQYTGNDDLTNKNYGYIITVQEWIKLPKELQSQYILEDTVAAIRDGHDFEFTDQSIVEK